MWADTISHEEILLRLGLALVIAMILGIEREFKQQPAGIRTHILICVGSCLLMILSIIVPEIYEATNKDPARIAAQVVSGVGFLGAGAIMRNGLTTKGLTTAANIWVTAAIGMTIGAGLYFVGIIAAILILINLIVFTKLKSKILIQNRYCSINLATEKKGISPTNMYTALSSLHLDIISYNTKQNKKRNELQLIARIDREKTIFDLEEKIKGVLDIDEISISENIKM